MKAGDARISDPAGSGSVLALALTFFIAGCALAVFSGPTLGALHAFAAFIVLTVVAALNQLLPVIITAPVARPALVMTFGAAFAAGFALLIAGFYGYTTFAAAGIVLSCTAGAWVVWNLVRLLRGVRERQTRIMIALAVLAFFAAAAAGSLMAAALGRRASASLLALAPMHAMLAAGAFASVLIVAVSYRFVPMFAVAKGNAYGKRAVQWVLAGACIAAACGAAAGHRPVLQIALAAVLVGGTWIAVSHVRTVALRLRRRLDVSIRYAAAGWAFGLLGCALAIAATVDGRFGTAAVIAVVCGWLCITTLGYIFKVAGFLSWQSARERHSASVAALPALSGAVDLRLAIPALVLLCIGTLGAVVASIALPAGVAGSLDAYGAGGLFALAAYGKLASTYLFGRFQAPERAHAAG